MPRPAIIDHCAAWTARLRYDDIPQNVHHAARRSVLDTIGVMTAATNHPLVGKLAPMIDATAADGPCDAMVLERRLAPPGAAHLNAAAAHALDYDDTSYTGIMHGAAVSFPAVLAAAQLHDSTGREFLTALTGALETTYTLATMLTPRHYHAGWWATGTCGIPGASLGAAMAFGLPKEQMRHAMGLATVEVFGSRAMFGSDAKPNLTGRAAATAVTAALSAHHGITGNADAFENVRGFLSLIAPAEHNIEALQELGQTWRQIDPGILYKRFPVCSAAHAPAQCIEDLMAKHGFHADAIEKIDCEIPRVVDISLIYDAPATPQEAQFSLPFAVACMAVFAGLTPRHLNTATLNDPRIKRLSQLTSKRVADDLASDPTAPEGARMTVILKDGARHEIEIRAPRGMPQNPLTDAQLTEKFIGCCDLTGITHDRARSWADRIMTIEDETSVRGLLRPSLAVG